MYDWSQTWQLKFHPDKCKRMRISNKKESSTCNYTLTHGLEPMEESESEKDIGVVIDNKLKFEDHIIEKVNKANSILGVISRTFEYLEKENFVMLYKSLVRPHLEYANQVWAPYRKKHIDMIENVQKRATRLVPGLKDLPYQERLKILKLPSLAYRRIRGDMIETFKILNNKYDYNPEELFTKRINITSGNTRGHEQMLFKKRARLDLKKNSFSFRVVDLWNSLPPSVIDSKTVKTFEIKLDIFWKDQDIKYDYQANAVKGLSIRHIEDPELVSQE